jgi:ABC-type hemin transport system substrate-binding protein
MEIKIGVQNAPRELTVDTDQTVESIEKMVAEAVEGNGVFAIADTKGRRVVVPGSRLAYVEIGTGVAGAVGFRS